MAEFSVNTHRLDPYKTYKFRVKWSADPGAPPSYVAGLQKCGGLKKTTEVIEWRSAGDPGSTVRKLTGRTNYQPLTFEQGVTHDLTFEKWANLVNNPLGDAANSPRNYRKDITIELLNEAGQVVIAYNLKRAWVSEMQALPDLDANGKSVAITSIKIEHEGYERDISVAEPAEP
jgi:phage tail-like protein